MKEKLKENKAVTLLALVITIIVLLILTGVTIATLMGDNGILTRASGAKENTKISEEKEKVSLAINSDLIANKGEKRTKNGIQTELDNIEGINKTKVIKDGKNSYIVTFLDTNRNYRIDETEI